MTYNINSLKMEKNIINFIGLAEYSVDLHLLEMETCRNKVMYITVTTVDDGFDTTVVLNGLPSSSELRKICGRDVDAATLIINTLKKDALTDAIEYWNFQEGEWVYELDESLKAYKAE